MFSRVYTVPNMISLFRILLIPFYIWFYIKELYWSAIAVLVVSGLSDTVDGFIARKFNQVSDLGKVLDPLADKLTQIAIVVCATIKVHVLIYLLVIVLVKESLMILFNLVFLKKGAKPISAKWYGKLATAVFYLGMGTIVIFTAINRPLSRTVIIIIACLIAIAALNSLISYFVFYKNNYDKNGNLKSDNIA